MKQTAVVYSRFLVLLLLALGFSSRAALPLTRVANHSLQMPASPPQIGFSTTNALGGLTFTNPIAIASVPGETNRLFLLEQRGRVIVITNLAAPTRTVFMDLSDRVFASQDDSVLWEEGLLGIAFHPGYATNGYFYLFYNTLTNTDGGSGLHEVVSRFCTSTNDPNRGLPDSELVLIHQFDQEQSHNGGDLHFGADGYLYISIGDEGGLDCAYGNCQRIDKNLFAGILRIDVDKRPGNLPPNPHSAVTTNYAIPVDNPFIGITNYGNQAVNPLEVRTEFWAVGLRNPWRFSIDPVTGEMYAGDVGQSDREEVDIITKGANYGWAWWEGSLAHPNNAPVPEGVVYSPPLLEYTHSVGYVAVGGVVYRGTRMSQLYGAYIFGDYFSGNVWALRHEGTNVTQFDRLALIPGSNSGYGSDYTLEAFGTDPRNGDILYATLEANTNGQIKRIDYTPYYSVGDPIPPTLAETGAFSNTTNLVPSPGMVPYDINTPFWSDGAIKSRWFCVPQTNQTIGFDATGNWTFPDGTIWMKHFELQLTNGVPASRRRVETRLLVKKGNSVYGVSYRWGDSLTNAALVADEGLNEDFVINDGGGVVRTQTWRYPARAECVQCHTSLGGLALGFNTAQLNRDHDYGTGPTNQIAALSLAGYFGGAVPNPATLPRSVDVSDTTQPLEARVRSFLAANCVQCHQPGGTASRAHWDGRLTTPTIFAGLLDGGLAENLGDPENRVIAPGDPLHSVMLKRISTRGNGLQMPPLATSVVYTQAVNLVTDWIKSLTNSIWVGASPASQSIPAGGTANFTVRAILTDDLSPEVSLGVTGLPWAALGTFTPATVQETADVALAIKTSPTTPTGAYQLSVNAAGGGVSNGATVALNITAPVTQLAFEAENLARTTNGAAAVVSPDANASGAAWVALVADAAGDTVEFTLPGIPAGTYRLVLRYKRHPSRGVAELQVDGVALSTTLDQYAAAQSYADFDWGLVTFATSGNHTVRLTVTGKNAASSGYWLGADRFTLNLAVTSPPPRITDFSETDAGISIVGTGGLPYRVYYVLTSTNLAVPVTNWTLLSPQQFDAAGGFNLALPAPVGGQQYYRLQVP